MPDAPALKLMLFDRTCKGRGPMPGLSNVWGAGRHLYRALGRLDASYGASTWADALDWLADVSPGRPIAEIQFWGHGHWGNALIDRESLDVRALERGHEHHDRLVRVRERFLPGDRGLWWFRTCETFGTSAGHDFARRWSRFFGCRAAGHTYVIVFGASGCEGSALSRGRPRGPDASPSSSGHVGSCPGSSE
jgi:hypothetical protein